MVRKRAGCSVRCPQRIGTQGREKSAEDSGHYSRGEKFLVPAVS